MPIKTDIAKLSVAEVQVIQEQTSELEAIVGNRDGLQTSLQDSGAVRRKLAKNKEILAKDEALRAKGRSKDAIAREMKQIEETIRRDRPSRAMMEARPGTPEFAKAVQANIAFQRKYGHLMIRLKDLKRRLDPDNPFAGNLESIRQT